MSLDYEMDHLGLGEPFETDLGLFTPLKMKDLHEFGPDLQVMSLDVLTIAYRMEKAQEKINDSVELQALSELIEEIRKSNLFQTVYSLDVIRSSYERLIKKTLDVDNPFEIIRGRKMFNYYRDLILGSSGVPKKVGHVDPEIQHAHERSERVKNEGKEQPTITNMISILATSMNVTFDVVKEFTVFQFYMLYQRSVLKYESDISIQRMLAGDEKAKYVDWMGNIDLLETDENEHFMTERQFLGFANSVLE